MAVQSVVDTVRRYLAVLQKNGIDAEFGVLFGSHARGEASELSDIDLIVVSAYFDSHRSRADVEPLWLLTLNVDASIEPIACGLAEWERDDSRPVLEIARTEGIRVSALAEAS